MSQFKDYSHLLRMAALFVFGILAFFLLRGLFVPRTFGQYGHFRGAALAEIAARPMSYAGHQACENCHGDVVDVKKAGKHAHVACESCHGPLAKHAEDPGSVTPEKLDTTMLCPGCHQANIAKPAGFPQVNAADHSSGQPCNTCHKPHTPAMDGGDQK